MKPLKQLDYVQSGNNPKIQRFNADDARKITKSYKASIDDYLALIRQAALSGLSTTQVDIQKVSEETRLSIISQLETLGFQVKRSNGYDVRDNDSWDTLIISWS